LLTLSATTFDTLAKPILSSSDHSTEAKANSARYGKAAPVAGSDAYTVNLIEEDGSLTKETAKLYKSFMQSYVTRINDASFRVPINGIRIGSAKYTRLAQINLKTRIITFSRFAIENVPERGRRYLVLHELAHVLEASHNKIFWQLVGRFEPEYKEIGLSLDSAFKKNVQSHEKTVRALKRKARGQYDFAPQQGVRPPIIWTPDHGYVEPGSRRFGLHQDPKELFFKSGDHQAEETYAAYLDLQNEFVMEGGSDSNSFEPFELPDSMDSFDSLDSLQPLNGAGGDGTGKSKSNCIFDADNAADQAQDLYVYEDEGEYDQFYGTMSGGDT